MNKLFSYFYGEKLITYNFNDQEKKLYRFNTQVYSCKLISFFKNNILNTLFFLALCSVFWLFHNIGLAYFILVFHTPLMLFLNPLRPRGKKDILYTFLNLIIISFYAYLFYTVYFGYNWLLFLKEIIVNFITLGSQFYFFFVSSLIITP